MEREAGLVAVVEDLDQEEEGTVEEVSAKKWGLTPVRKI